jgi:SSS family transporter
VLDGSQASTLGGALTWLDWTVVALLFAATSWIGTHFAGKQATIRDFFLGGRKLPWYAVSGSIIATEISAVTLISLPSVIFKPGGNITYLQLGLIGLFIARWIVALWLVPAYYEREIYSPYDFMAQRLGERARNVTTVFFAIGCVLGQSARVYLTGLVLEIVLYDEFAWISAHTGIPGIAAAIAVIGIVSIAWTWAGGMATVIWTDTVLFLIFLVAIAAALVTVVAHVDGGAGEIARLGADAGKFRFFNFSLDPKQEYTLWTALIANTWVGVGAFGTDQLMAQRVFCCKNLRDAQKAMITSYASMLVAVLVSLVGIGLYAFYHQHPLSGESLRLYDEKNDRIFPLFIVQVMPTPMRGLIVAGVFAAAISTVESVLAALSQTTISAFWLPMRRRRGVPDDASEQKRVVRLSRALVIFFGVVLSVLAVLTQFVEQDPRFKAVLNLALSLSGYTQGALLAGFVLAWFKWGVDGTGLVWSAPLSLLTVFAVAWQPPEHEWARTAVWIATALFAVAWAMWRIAPARESTASKLATTTWLALGLGVAHAVQLVHFTVAWPWFVPIGCTTATLFGYLLAVPKPKETP